MISLSCVTHEMAVVVDMGSYKKSVGYQAKRIFTRASSGRLVRTQPSVASHLGSLAPHHFRCYSCQLHNTTTSHEYCIKIR